MWPWRGPRGEVCVLVTCQVIHKDGDAFLRTDSEKKKKKICPPQSVLYLSSFSLAHEDRTYQFLQLFCFSEKRKRTSSQDSGEWFEDPLGVRRIKVNKHNFKGHTLLYTIDMSRNNNFCGVNSFSNAGGGFYY